MSNLFKNIISLKDQNYIKHIVTPITPYLLCNHFVSTELHKNSRKYVHYKLDIKANDLLKNKNYNITGIKYNLIFLRNGPKLEEFMGTYVA